MLVVLAVFAVIAGAVVLSVPGPRVDNRSDLALLAIQSRIDAAVDLALARGTGFGIWQDGADVYLLEQAETGAWRLARDPRLNPVKLSAATSRISFRMDDDRVFAVTPALIPEHGKALRIVLADGPDALVLVFDGLNAHQKTPEAKQDATPDR